MLEEYARWAERLVKLMRLEDAHFVTSEFAQGLDSKEPGFLRQKQLPSIYLMYKSTPVVKRLPGQDVGKRYLRLSLATSEIDDTSPTSQAFPVTQIAKSSNRDGTTGKKRIEKQCRTGRG